MEYKGDMAAQVARMLSGAPDEGDAIQHLLDLELARYNIPTHWDSSSAPVETPNYRRDPTDHERRMEWLRTSVASAIESLSAAYTEEDILNALGIWYTPTRPVTPDVERAQSSPAPRPRSVT